MKENTPDCNPDELNLEVCCLELAFHSGMVLEEVTWRKLIVKWNKRILKWVLESPQSIFFAVTDSSGCEAC